MMKVIAFYLPQYHPTPNNNQWWGKGFTEWTNVAKAKPLFRGHYQPKIPADLGFYDLRLPEVRKQQADMAREYGISAFCYYHYWFGGGHQELERPFNEVVESGEPNYPFCLCWANESWARKFWNKDGNVASKKILAEQKYLGEQDNIEHFYTLLKAFKDKRYLRIEGRPVFLIYRPLDFVEQQAFIELWNKLAKENGMESFYFIAYSVKAPQEYDKLKKLGFDAVCSCYLGYGKQSKFQYVYKKIISVLFNTPRRIPYKKIAPQLVTDFERDHNDVYPTMIPNWDHTPRSKEYGLVYTNSTPELFEAHAKDVLDHIKDKPEKDKICFIKSWNEWGEGNYLEPDMKFGHGYLESLKRAINNFQNDKNT